MTEETVEVGDTEVTITETDDGFEVTESADNELAEYVRENVRMAGHEKASAANYRRVEIVDARNNIISNSTFRDIVNDERLSLGQVKVERGDMKVVVYDDGR